MHCLNCGAELGEGSGFCARCGTRAGAASAPATSSQTGGGLQSNVAGFLCYLVGFITGIFFLVSDPYKRDRFVRFHAFQAIFLSIAWFAAYFVLGIFSSVLPGVLWRLGLLLQSASGLGFFCLWLFLMYKAYKKEEFRLPVIGGLAAKHV